MFRATACLTLTVFAATSALAIGADLPPGALVRQGSAVLTVDDIDAFAARIPLDQRAGYFDNSKRLESTLRQLLVERQVANDARAMSLDKDPDVQRQILIATENALATARVAKIRETAQASIPDMGELAQERYQANRDNFNVHEVLDVVHILISTSRHSDEEARALAEKVRAEAIADPQKFAELVTKYSEDPSAKDNVGLMRQAGDSTKYVPEFAQAANALTTPEEVSAVVKTKFGYHVLMLVKKEPARNRTFAEIKDDLLKELGDEYVTQQIHQYMQAMQNHEVESNAELVNSLRTRYGQAVLTGADEQATSQAGHAEAEPASGE